MTYSLTAELILQDALVWYLWSIGFGLCTGLIWVVLFSVIRFR